MTEITITGIDMQRKKMYYQGEGREVMHMTAPDPLVSFTIRSELMQADGEAHLLEEERDALLTLITRIEERLMEDSQRRA